MSLQVINCFIDRISGSKLTVDSLKFDYNTGGIPIRWLSRNYAH